MTSRPRGFTRHPACLNLRKTHFLSENGDLLEKRQTLIGNKGFIFQQNWTI